MQHPEAPPPYNPNPQYGQPQFVPPTNTYYPPGQQPPGVYPGTVKAGYDAPNYAPPQSYPQGYNMPPPGANGTTVVVTQLGNCPSCHVGNLIEGFSLCGIVMAVLFFPIGILCCLMMQEKKCSHCGAEF